MLGVAILMPLAIRLQPLRIHGTNLFPTWLLKNARNIVVMLPLVAVDEDLDLSVPVVDLVAVDIAVDVAMQVDALEEVVVEVITMLHDALWTIKEDRHHNASVLTTMDKVVVVTYLLRMAVDMDRANMVVDMDTVVAMVEMVMAMVVAVVVVVLLAVAVVDVKPISW